MKKLLPIFLLVLILSAGYLAIRMVPANNPRPARPIKLATGTWEPFIGPNLEENGPIASIVSETLQRMGYEPELSFSSWSLTLDQTRRAEVIGAFPFISSRGRRELYDFSDPIVEFEYVLFFNTSRIQNPEDIRTAEDFARSNYRFGKVAGYEVWPELASAVTEFREYDTSLDAFRALARGEIDFLPEGRLPGLAIIQGPDILADANQFGILGAPDNSLLWATEEVYFLMPKSNESQKFLNAFNVALAQVKETPLYREVQAQVAGTSSQAELVELRPIPGETYITVIAASDETTQFHVPLGTRAIVIEWPESYSGQGEMQSGQPIYCKVKLLNGPQQGRVVLVDSSAISLMGY
jgi:polar amino acid transport system substrate-binding protein